MRAPTEHLGGWARRALLLLIIPAARALSLCCSRAVWPQATVGARNPAGVHHTLYSLILLYWYIAVLVVETADPGLEPGDNNNMSPGSKIHPRTPTPIVYYYIWLVS